MTTIVKVHRVIFEFVVVDRRTGELVDTGSVSYGGSECDRPISDLEEQVTGGISGLLEVLSEPVMEMIDHPERVGSIRIGDHDGTK